MYKRKDSLIRNNRYEVLNYSDEKKSEGSANRKYNNVSYHIRKLFSYCDSDILQIENNLLIYNSIIENIKKNGNKLIKHEVEKIIREKDGNPNYCLTEMEVDECKIKDFDLQKVELDFHFIECSLCFELIKFVCIQECNHTFCFLCFHRLMNMGKLEQEDATGEMSNNGDRSNNGNGNSNNVQNSSNRNNNRNNNYNNRNNNNSDRYNNNSKNGHGSNNNSSRSRFSLSYVDYIEPGEENSIISQCNDKDCNDFQNNKQKLKLKCPFCKEENEYMFICLNNFYTYFTHDNLLHTLLAKENNKELIKESEEFVELNEEYLNKKWEEEGDKTCKNLKTSLYSNSKSKNKETKEKSREESGRKIRHYKGGMGEGAEEDEKSIYDLRKQSFYSYYDDMIVLQNMLRKNEGLNKKPNVAKSRENMYLFFHYEKYIKWKKKRIKYILNCIRTKKKYAFFCKVFLDICKNIIYEYFYIFSIATVLTNYVCLLSPCRDYWTKIQAKKIEKYKYNNKTDNYFESIYIKNDKAILRKKNDSIYGRYQQHSKQLGQITDEEEEQSDEFFKVVDIFSKSCFTNLDNVNFLVYLKYYSYPKLSDLNKHLLEHRKAYCDICAAHNDNIFLFEYNIFYKRYLKNHIDQGEEDPQNRSNNVRHVYCHLCNIYLYDFDSFQNHINKYHFFCKFCFNKPLNEASNPINDVADGNIYYDELYLHVYKDYTSLFEHYKRKHYPCLYEQCIFVVFDNSIDLCIHLAKKHDEKEHSKKNRITLSIASSPYNEVRNHSRTGDAFENKEEHDNIYERKDSNDIYKCGEETSVKEGVDIKSLKCIYNFSKFEDVWYFDYFVECKIKNFITYFESKKKNYFLYLMKTDMELILKSFEELSQKNPEVFLFQEEILELNKNILSADFANNRKNNFFVFRMFFDYVVETTDFLSYHKEDLEKEFMYLFFNIIVKKTFVLYYALFFLYLSKKNVHFENVRTTEIKKGKIESQRKIIYKYDDTLNKLKKKIETITSVNLQNLSKYGFMYLTFLFLKIDKYGFERATTFLKSIVAFCHEIYENASNGKEGIDNIKDDEHIYISLNSNSGKKKEKDSFNYPSFLRNNIKSTSIGSIELENIEELICANIRKNKMNNSIISYIYNSKLEVSKKITLDLLYYIQPDLNLTSFFYIFLNNYFAVDMRDKNANVISKISNENRNKIKKKIASDVDLTSLTTISRDLGNFINAQILEECLSTGAEYYRIRKDVQNVLQAKNGSPKKADRQEKGKGGNVNKNTNTGNKKNSNLNIYEISFSLRNRFPNIVKNTKTMELYFIYFYIHSIINFTNSTTNKENDEFPSLVYENGETGSYINSYKGRLEMNRNEKRQDVDEEEEFPALTETRMDGGKKNMSNAFYKRGGGKRDSIDTNKKGNKDFLSVERMGNKCLKKNSKNNYLSVKEHTKHNDDSFKNSLNGPKSTFIYNDSGSSMNNIKKNIKMPQNSSNYNNNSTIGNGINRKVSYIEEEIEFPPIIAPPAVDFSKGKTNKKGGKKKENFIGKDLDKLNEFPALNAFDKNNEKGDKQKVKNKKVKNNKNGSNSQQNCRGNFNDSNNVYNNSVKNVNNKNKNISVNNNNNSDNNNSKNMSNNNNNNNVISNNTMKNNNTIITTNNKIVDTVSNYNGLVSIICEKPKGKKKNNYSNSREKNNWKIDDSNSFPNLEKLDKNENMDNKDVSEKGKNSIWDNVKDKSIICGLCAYENLKNRDRCELCENKL